MHMHMNIIMHMHIIIYRAGVSRRMPGKNVALRSEVIEKLDREKLRGESYSDVIMRLTSGRRPMREVVEALERMGPVKDDGLTRRVQEIRRASRKDKHREAKF